MVQWSGMKAATKAEREHLGRVKELPCCVCFPSEQRSMTEVHHIVRDNKRLGHFFVLPLCHAHHQNVSRLKKLERSYWQLLNETLGIKREWPQSKIVAR